MNTIINSQQAAVTVESLLPGDLFVTVRGELFVKLKEKSDGTTEVLQLGLPPSKPSTTYPCVLVFPVKKLEVTL